MTDRVRTQDAGRYTNIFRNGTLIVSVDAEEPEVAVYDPEQPTDEPVATHEV